MEDDFESTLILFWTFLSFLYSNPSDGRNDRIRWIEDNEISVPLWPGQQRTEADEIESWLEERKEMVVKLRPREWEEEAVHDDAEM